MNSEGQPLSCSDLNLVLYGPFYCTVSCYNTSFLLRSAPSLLKKGGLGGQRNCVSRFLTIRPNTHKRGLRCFEEFFFFGCLSAPLLSVLLYPFISSQLALPLCLSYSRKLSHSVFIDKQGRCDLLVCVCVCVCVCV